MRKTNKWLVLLLALVMAVNAFGISAMAAENNAPLGLYVSPAAESGMVQVDILATADQIVADGKLVVTYDPAVLTYEGTEIGAAWTNADQVTLSVNAKDGKVILAFASVDTAKADVLFSIRFSGAVCDTAISVDGGSSYITGTGKVSDMSIAYCPSAQFKDLGNLFPEAHSAIDYMVGMGYMQGMAQTVYGPHVDLNRAMMVTILYRIAGSPAVEAGSTFTDVPAGEFYAAPVAWAVANGITYGISEHLFAPGKSLTRQELVTFLHRFAGVMGYDRTATTDLSAYTDAAKVQPYATEAFQWAVAAGIIKGTTETTLDPEATTTRAQVSLMVYRLLSQQD